MIRLYLDGSTTPVQVQESADGSFSISLSGLAPGSHTLTATAQSAGENESAPTAPRAFAGPPAPVVVPPPVTVPPVVTPPPAPGSWANVTPPGISFAPIMASGSNDNFGVQEVLVDPARPSDAYLFTCYQGIWKSTDYGLTWAKIAAVNKSPTFAPPLTAGKLWAAGIDPNPKRDPSTPPTMYCALGANAVGVLKSTDGGLTWVSHSPSNQLVVAISGNNYFGGDVGSIAVDPYDVNHLIVGFHGYPGVSESTDGGITWKTIAVPPDFGNSCQVFFVDTGNAATTRTTWLSQAQWEKNVNGIYRTSDAGASWVHVAPTVEHLHGGSQICQLGGGIIFVGAVGGIYKSVDYGLTFKQVSTVQSGGIVSTSKGLYSTSGFASNGIYAANLQTAALDGNAWAQQPQPAGMTNGWLRAAVTSDGKSDIILAPCWDAGLFRMQEA